MQAVARPAGVGVRCIDPCLNRDPMHRASPHATRRDMIEESGRRALFQLGVTHGSYLVLQVNVRSVNT